MKTKSLQVLGVLLNYDFERRKNAVISPLLNVIKNYGNLSNIIDIEIANFIKKLLILKNFHPDVDKWKFKYHLDINLRKFRSKKAERIINKLDSNYNVILQWGSEFNLDEIKKVKNIPKFSYQDNNLHGYLKGATSLPKVDASIRAALAYEAQVYDGLTGIFTMTKLLRKIFINDFKLLENKVHYAGFGCHLDDLQDEDKKYDGRTILFVAIHGFEIKGGKVVLDAFSYVRKEISDARLLLVGQDLNIDIPGVECIGFMDKNNPEGKEKLENLYKSASIFVMPSYNEATGTVFLEAMAHKVPCIGANCCSMPEIITENNCGFVIEPGNSKELAKKICMLLKDEALMCKKWDKMVLTQ
jgi:glycosyltransferase involved in cell wall biosynthesis